MSHTPGPWELETVRTSVGVCHKIGKLGKSTKLNHACLYDDCYSDKPRDLQLLADAHLIAAAPELLEALKEIARLWDGPKEKAALSYVQLEKAKLAIAKAERMP